MMPGLIMSMIEMMKMLMIGKSTWRLEEEQQLQLPPVEPLPAELQLPEQNIKYQLHILLGKEEMFS